MNIAAGTVLGDGQFNVALIVIVSLAIAGLITHLMARGRTSGAVIFFVVSLAVGLGIATLQDRIIRDEMDGAGAAAKVERARVTPESDVVVCTRADLKPIRGKIVSTEGDGLVIDCPRPYIPPRQSVAGISAGNAAGDSKRLAQMEIRFIREHEEALAAAAKVVSGVVVLTGHPQEREFRAGMPIEVVAAPVAGRTYTMRYELRNASPSYVPMTPAPLVVPRKLTTEEQNAEIARKYGAPK